ncbi:MAG: hypothetical protein MJK04_23665 [Psychrosphaera sp.]|nr:hypothetical protein [Psychrosphaera sp.]
MTFYTNEGSFKKTLGVATLFSLMSVSSVVVADDQQHLNTQLWHQPTGQPNSLLLSPCPRYPRCNDSGSAAGNSASNNSNNNTSDTLNASAQSSRHYND